MILKTILDYYETVCSEYPDIPESDIKRILQYGFKSLYLHNSYGGDTLLNLKGFWFYAGLLTNDSLKHFNYYKKKLRIKLRVLYKRKKIQWDGNYYFALTQAQYDDYLKQTHKKGRPRKNFTFNKIILYKIFDECNIIESNHVAIFKVSNLIDLGFSFYKEEITINQPELVLERPPLTFNDILITNYNYQYI